MRILTWMMCHDVGPHRRDTISILRGLRERYELHHGVSISDNALVEAAVLADRYIADRFLPDKVRLCSLKPTSASTY
jgi:hypothetical protein